MASWNSANTAYFQHVYGSKALPQPPIARINGYEIGPSLDTHYFNSQRGRIFEQLSPNTMFVGTRFFQLPKVDIQLFMKIFKQNLNFGMYTEFVTKMMLRKFAEVAAKYSPPNIGKANIEEKYYYRPIVNLVELAKGLARSSNGRRLHATKEDFAALRKGLKFKVLNTKHGVKRGTVYAYTKGINEAKRVARIANRGLTKYSWGNILNTFSFRNIQNVAKFHTAFGAQSQKPGEVLTRTALYAAELPVIFQRLQKKSPSIKKYRWATATYFVRQPDGRRCEISIDNHLADVERYCDIAMRQGVNAAVREVNKLVRAIESGAADQIEKMLSFAVYRVTQLTAVGKIKQRTLQNYKLGPYNPKPRKPRGKK